ncbi:MAG: GIY-YIG nuclease family protein [Gordonia sp. (in: high G+C Gram-positive bacteria)]|uniref:GIY-YIG nuclease family protein n=1 Tax=Gordonia sp. (in: high G+C Gram-positive bacteria) TaxID=84139 RepID=UPI003C77095D
MSAPDVQRFRTQLGAFLNQRDDAGRKWADSQWGVYAFYDFDGEPIYVGQTNEQLRTRVRRHLTNQRTDAVAMRVLDVMEVAEVEIWPLWDLGEQAKSGTEAKNNARHALDAYEYSAYLNAIEKSKFKAILNEKIPPVSARVEMPQSLRYSLVSEDDRIELGHPDIRIARRAETISRLSDVIRERGEVSDGLRRVLVIQAIRLTYLSAERLAYVEHRPVPRPTAIDPYELIGSSQFPDSRTS